MANATQRSDIIKLVVMATGGAPGTTLLGELVVAFDGGKTLTQIAADLTASDSFRATYPIFATPEEFSTEFLTNILPGVGTAIIADVVPIAVGILNSGGTRADILVAASQFLASLPLTDPVLSTQAALFQNQVEIATYHTVTLERDSGLDTALQGVTADAASVTTAKATLDAVVPPTAQGQTFSLTTSATDTPNGTANNDTFIGQLGQSTTLQSSDTINGGSGTDTLRVVTDGTAAQSATGFTTTSVEVLEVQAQATGGSTLSLENVTGVTTIRSASSSGALILNQVKAIAALEVQGALNAQALTVNYQAAAVAGTADVQTLSSNGNVLGGLTVNGVETLAITTATANSSIASITGDKFTTLTAAGDKSVSITAALPTTVKTVDASAQTAGGISVTAGVADVKVTGGAGSDTVTFTGAFTSADSFDGGAGRDTIIANQAEYTGSSYAASAKISNVETIRIADKLTAAFDAGKITGEDTYRLDSGFTGPVTISDAPDASTINVRAASTGTLTYTIGKAATLATATGTANTLNIAVGGANGVDAGTIASAGVETMTLASNGSSTTAGGNTLTITGAETTALTVTGSEDLTLAMTGTALSTLDASASTGKNDFSAVTYKAATAAVITGGTGIDTIVGSGAGDTINGGAGADIITGGAGGDTITGGAGADTFKYNTASDSNGTSLDTITDFTTGSDKFDFAALATSVGRSAVVLKNGATGDFGTAQAAIAQTSGTTQAVFQADTNTLWVDLNDDGTLNNNDLSIKLTGVTSLVAADIGANAAGNTITLSAAAAVVNATTSTNASAVSTALNDSISSTEAFLAGSTIDGGTGTDTLTLTTVTSAAIPVGVTNVENLVLATVGTTANVALGFNDAGIFSNVTGTANSDTIADTVDLREGGKISLGAGNDVITALNLFETTADADTSYKFDIDMGAGNDSVTAAVALTLTSDSKLNGGDGTDTLVLVAGANNLAAGSVTNFETLTLGAAGTTTLTLAQYNAFTTRVLGTGSIQFTDTGAVSDKTDSTATRYRLNDGGQTFTGNNALNYGITGAAGNDTFILKAGFTATGDSFNGFAGTDTFDIAYDVAGDINTRDTPTTLQSVENLIISVAQSVDYTLRLDTELLTLDASAGGTAGKATTVVATNAAMTSVKLGAGNDVIQTVTANSAALTVELGAGNDAITTLNTGAGALTIDSGTGNLTIGDIDNLGAGLLTLKFAAPVSGSTSSASIGTADLNVPVGTVIDFATNVTSVISGAANGSLGVAGAAGQLFVEVSGGNTTLTFDADGDRAFSVGDVQIVITGNAISGGIDTSGNFVVGSSA